MQTDRPTIVEADYRVTESGEVVPGEGKRPSRLRGLLGPLVGILIFLATKLKFLVVALKGVKFLSTGLTAIVSIGAYALAFNWQFGVGLVVLLFIHEMGHVIALRKYGVKASAPIFIPFLGAFIGMKQLPKNATMEAVVGLGGPVIGSLGALAAWIIYEINGHPIFLVMTYLGIILNLFNLLPILPLDGGRAVGVLSRWFWVIGFVGLVGLMFVWPSPIFLLILIFAAPEVWSRIRNRKSDDEAEYYSAPLNERLAVGAAYFGLIFILGFALYELAPLMNENRPA